MIMNHPVIYENCLRTLFGERIYTHEYCPPATGYSEHISAIEYATHNETQLIPIHPQIMTGGPPALTPETSTPPRALQHVTTENEKPIIPSRLKDLWSSGWYPMLPNAASSAASCPLSFLPIMELIFGQRMLSLVSNFFYWTLYSISECEKMSRLRSVLYQQTQAPFKDIYWSSSNPIFPSALHYK